MAKAKVIPLFDQLDTAFQNMMFDEVMRELEIKAQPAASYGSELREFRVPLYSQGQHCPNCGRRAWHIQRTQAECGKCGEVLPLKRG